MSTQESYPTLRAIASTLTQALARVDEAQEAGLWPGQLSATQKRLMAQATLAYGLDPLMQELTVYQGKPLVTIRGRRRKDAEAGHRPSIRFRFLTQEEKTEFQYAGVFQEGDLAMYCVLTTEDGNTVEGFGKCTKAERESGRQPVAKDNPIEMCQKRAEDRARLMAYGPIPLPAGLSAFAAEVLSEYQSVDTTVPDVLPAPASQVEAGYFCADHNTPFQQHERDGRVWYSHRQGGGWHNMKETTEEPPPAAVGVFDPPQETTLPESVHSVTLFKQLLEDLGWTVNRLEIEVLGTSLAGFERNKAVDQAYQIFRRYLAKQAGEGVH